MDRRKFIKYALLTAIAGLSVPATALANAAKGKIVQEDRETSFNNNLYLGQKFGADTGGGDIVFGMAEASIPPSAPTQNGIVIFCSEGKLKVIQANGTIVTVGA